MRYLAELEGQPHILENLSPCLQSDYARLLSGCRIISRRPREYDYETLDIIRACLHSTAHLLQQMDRFTASAFTLYCLHG